MKMRKILSFVLVLSLVLGSFSMAFAATPADVVGTPNQEAVEVLMGLGVVNGYEDGSFKPENIVTRAEMAKLIVVALGLEDYATGTSKFPDMAGATWAQGYVNYAAGLGIIKGYPDGTFKPSATVSYDEATAMIVRALGYTDASLLPAMWPANYVVKAKALGILDGIKTSALGANRGDIAEMLYNAIGLAIGTVDADNKWAANTDDTMLLRLGAEEYNNGDAFLVMGDEPSDINLRPYVGAWATAYTMDDDIVAVYAKSTFLTGTVQKDDMEFVVGDVTYKISNAAAAYEKATTGSIFNTGTAGAYLGNDFYNGEFESYALTSNTHAIDTIGSASPMQIAVDLDGNTITKVYSVMAWGPKDATGIIDANDLEDMNDDQFLFNTSPKAIFVTNDDDEIDMNSLELVGVKSLSDIKVGDVVYAYRGFTSKNIRKIAVGTEEVTGKVTRVSSDGKEFTIGGKAYTLSHWPEGYFGATGTATWSAIQYFDINVGDTGTAKLDAYGNVYSWDVTDATADNYAVVEASDFLDLTAFKDAKVKLTTKTGDTIIYDVNSDADVASSSGITPGDLVVFALDKDGNIDTLTEKAWSTTGNLTLSSNRTVFSNMLIDSPAVVFTTESGVGYDVTNLGDVKTGTPLAGAKYFVNTDSKIAVMLVDVDVATGTDTNVYAFINSTASAINADDDTVVEVVGVSAGKEYTALTVNESSTENGIVKASTPAALHVFTVNAAGAVKLVEVTSAAVGVTDVVVVAIDGQNLQITPGATWVQIETTAFVVQYDISDKEYTVADFSDIRRDSVVTLFQISEDSIDDGTYDYVVVTVL